MRLSDENIRSRTVIASDGVAVGEIALLLFDSDSLRLESLEVKLRSDVADRIGVDRSVFHAAMLEIPMAMVQSIGDAVVLGVAVEELRRLSDRGSESARIR